MMDVESQTTLDEVVERLMSRQAQLLVSFQHVLQQERKALIEEVHTVRDDLLRALEPFQKLAIELTKTLQSLSVHVGGDNE